MQPINIFTSELSPILIAMGKNWNYLTLHEKYNVIARALNTRGTMAAKARAKLIMLRVPAALGFRIINN